MTAAGLTTGLRRSATIGGVSEASQRDRVGPLGIIPPGPRSSRAGLAVLGIGLFVYFSLKYDNFLSIDNAIAISLNMSAMTIAAIGTMALLVSGNVDLSIGSQYALVAMTTAWVLKSTGNTTLGIATAIVTGLVLGLINGLLVQWLRISPLIVTIGTLALYRGLAYHIGDGLSVSGFPKAYRWLGTTRWWGIPLPVFVAALVFAVGAWILSTTVAGVRLYAIGGSRDSARMAGLPVGRTTVAMFTVNGGLIGIVALLGTSKLNTGAPNFGLQFEMAVLTAVILGGVAFNGGMGRPLGVLVGVLTIGVIESGLTFAGFQEWHQQMARGSLLVAALIADQILLGIRRRRRRERALAGRGAPAAEAAVVPPDTAALRLSTVGADRSQVLLEVRNATVQYSGTVVLEDASLTVHAGEVVCLVGDNGAGKSTLIKVISGAVRPSSGTVALGGEVLELSGPIDARRAGIETVYQDLALCSNLGIAHNMVLGEEPKRRLGGVLPVRDDRRATVLARQRLDSLGATLDDLSRPVAELSGGQRQTVSISRVLTAGVRLVILDEPTAALGVTQTAEVLELVRSIARAGRGVILISHDVEDIFEVADRVVILRLGRVILDTPISRIDRLELLRLMSGRHDPTTG